MRSVDDEPKVVNGEVAGKVDEPEAVEAEQNQEIEEPEIISKILNW